MTPENKDLVIICTILGSSDSVKIAFYQENTFMCDIKDYRRKLLLRFQIDKIRSMPEVLKLEELNNK